MASKLRSAVSSTHIKFRDTVFGYIHQHEKNASITVAALIKYLCLEYYLLKEEWTSGCALYPLHWICNNGHVPLSNDWSKRTKYEVNQVVGYRRASFPSIQAQIGHLKKNEGGDITKLFLHCGTLSNTYHPTYRWITIPNDRLFPPHLIKTPHFDGISGTLPINSYDDSIAEYRWTFELLQLRPFSIGLLHQGDISAFKGVPHERRFSSLYQRMARIWTSYGLL